MPWKPPSHRVKRLQPPPPRPPRDRREEQKDYNRDRRQRQEFYNSGRWRRIRKQFITLNPLCESCKNAGVIEPARVVDHIEPIEYGGDPYAGNNLQSLCVPCHARKTGEDQRRERARF